MAIACVLLAAPGCSTGDTARSRASLADLAAEQGEAACGRLATLGGNRIRLAPALGSAELRVRPAALEGAQMRWLLEDGWDVEDARADRTGSVRAREDQARIRLPASPCAGAEPDAWRVLVDVGLSAAGPEGAVDRVTASLAAAGGPQDSANLHASAPGAILEAGVEDPSRESSLTIRSDPMGAVTAKGIVLPLGHARLEVDHTYRDAILASSTRKATFRIVPPDGATLAFALALLPGPRVAGSESGGWEFRISAAAEGGEQQIFHETVSSAGPESVGRWLERKADLSAWAGQKILLTLEAAPNGEDRSLAVWGSPVVRAGEKTPGPSARPNILLISVDTLRADRIGRVNQGHELTPAIDRLSAEAASFTRCRAQAPSTLYSHASMLTGLLSSAHGATPTAALAGAVPYAPDLLAAAGYATAALTDDGLVDGRFGFPRGFDAYLNRAQPIEERVDEAIGAMQALPSPWFLFVHTYQVHAPYASSPRFTEPLTRGYDGPFGATFDPATFARVLSRMNNGKLEASPADIRHLENLYDAQVMRTDAALAKIFRALRDRGQWMNTAVIVTSDHGDEFDEHGLLARHSLTCYDELMRVPLILKPPAGLGTAPREIGTSVRLMDIAPTLLDLAGVPAPEGLEGISLVPLLRNVKEEDRDAVCEIEDARGAAIVRWPWKYHMRAEWSVDDPRTLKRRLETWGPYAAEELYDLRSDPGERNNLAPKIPEKAAELRALLDTKLAAARASFTERIAAAEAPPHVQEDAEHLERLRALGYVE